MLLNARRTTARLLPPNAIANIATVFIEEGGGGANIPSKVLATLWYLLVLPDAQTRLHQQIQRKRVPWYAPARILSILVSATNIITMPLSWGLLIAGKRNAARLASLGVLANPPSITLTLLLISEIAGALLKKSGGIACGLGSAVTKPFAIFGKMISGNGSPASVGISDTPKPATSSATSGGATSATASSSTAAATAAEKPAPTASKPAPAASKPAPAASKPAPTSKPGAP